MKIDRIDRDALRLIAATAMPALQAALAPFGITVKPARSKYSNGSTGTFQVELVAAGANPEREEFERWASLMGFEPSDFGREFTVNRVRYALCGIAPGRSKYPIIGERTLTGVRYKFTADAVKRAFAAEGVKP
jgi:hypothetical protein